VKELSFLVLRVKGESLNEQKKLNEITIFKQEISCLLLKACHLKFSQSFFVRFMREPLSAGQQASSPFCLVKALFEKTGQQRLALRLQLGFRNYEKASAKAFKAKLWQSV